MLVSEAGRVTSQNMEALFTAALPTIERIVGALNRRYGLHGAAAEEFSSWVTLKLIENDYAVLRKFRGESALATYLTVVVAMLGRDYRAQQWGRWRPSAAARHRGEVAILLEALVYRDGLPFSSAVEMLRARLGTTMPERELIAMFRELPVRAPLRPVEVGAELLSESPGQHGADDRIVSAERRVDREVALGALERAMTELAEEDRVILRLRFWQGLSIADIARALSLPQKPLYRRIERALEQMRARLEGGGLSEEAVRTLLSEGIK
jgi:RNA polymerase sigma factor for flagellar operon FliA